MLEKLKNVLENTKVTPISWLLGLSGIILVRLFLEALSSPTFSGVITSDAPALVHYYLFFLSFALMFTILFRIAIPEWKNLAPQITLFAFILIFIAPIIDFINGKERMSYLFVGWHEITERFFTFFGPLGNGITLGMRIGIVIILLSFFWLTYKIKKDFSRSIRLTIILYIIIFLLSISPILLGLMFGENMTNSEEIPLSIQNLLTNSSTFANNLHGSLTYAYPIRILETAFNFMMGKLFFIISIILMVTYFLTSTKEKTISVIRNSRPERIAFYFIAILGGAGFGYLSFPVSSFTWNDALSLVVLLISAYFAFIFAICTNDLEDTEIDAVSNASRPLIKNELGSEDMKQIAGISLLTSLLGAYLAGYYAFFCMLAFTALYYIYSVSPTRFKRVPFFSSLLIAWCVLSQVMAGFFTFSNVKLVEAFPTQAIFLIISFTFLWSHIRDLKDIEGDRLAGVNTPAVLFGEKFVGILASVSYLLVPIFLSIYFLFITAIPASILTYYFCVRKPYRELPIFVIYFTFTILSTIPLFIFSNIL